tara:strand:- start:2733 stop:2981 length:249 start_codon:yes stop_codon:yes gene_type:complete
MDKDGGPAFPSNYTAKIPTEDPEFTRTTTLWSPGMTLRQYYAGQALSGILAGRHVAMNEKDRGARLAFDWADAMIELEENGG